MRLFLPVGLFLSECTIFSVSSAGIAKQYTLWVVAGFEALSCQVTVTFYNGYTGRIRSTPAVNNTACVFGRLSHISVLFLNQSQ